MDTSKQMPNLMGAAHGAADGNRRILAQLEYGPKAGSRAAGPARAWSFDGWTVGLVLLLLTLGGLAWLMHEETITPVTFKRHAEGDRHVKATAAQDTVEAAAKIAENVANAAAGTTMTATAVDVMPAARAAAADVMSAASAAPAAAYAGSSDVHAEHPAAIINQPRLAASAPSGTFAVPLSSTSAGERSMAVASGPPHRTGTPTRINDTGKTANKAGSHKSTIASYGKPAPVAPRVRPGSSPIPPAASDTDVTLLTALVAHANKPASVAPEPSRDVVERVDGVSTADLLARCKQLGLMEGMLCRSRICSGGWESDPVCRAPAN
ncbi:hypothetical protein [Duganella sp. FT27W]|uniref:hypothetical protein n=1 Tax=Duganella sp. FT27W TaxID=2654636 RepID=UPI00128B649B|nr:hypothetical protein [Duganella sp. FT27W]MPQ58191.1 hypothetical protein [Duganella sp. FT27W]